MRRLVSIIILVLAVVVTASAYERIQWRVAEKGKYKVVRVYDGDTFTILVPPRYTFNVRISGIDAPERTQEFGMYARALLENLIGGEDVVIYPIELDKWGRTVAKCFNYEGKDLGLLMLQMGMAWHYSQYDDTQEYIDAEREARYTQMGLWARPNPMSPQEYRVAPRSVKRKNQ